ncbi:MAG: DNA gyrase inhibitor YacG [Pseudomonadales bacterium]|nr:DNA gyrase inhibitor YacG [Pseudomonadales bacterium]MBO6564904.1 DNA gyrase inhibitor YacG [Pseudomonadales bacterium]MBO6594268.1 DNA gyrase inhibitor YacG [Pseudomonadales bacterium]MBO6656269.1 DNA gyrase inhibitor YacG [Pseudomonadales bacterium]MBO6700767.1 DNA gyrase inhibitor YacG [Pseudomonadales bacterium]
MADVIVKCPSCDKAVAWVVSSKFRPFCSDRCRLIDLGEWAAGNQRIASDPAHDDVTESDLNGPELS